MQGRRFRKRKQWQGIKALPQRKYTLIIAIESLIQRNASLIITWYYRGNIMKEIEGIKLYTIQEIAEMLKVHPLTIQRKEKKGIIKGVKINKSWYISSD